MNRRVAFDTSSSVSFPAWPKSTRPIRSGAPRTRMFAGCGSAWKNPCRKTMCIHASAIVYASRRRSSSVYASSGDVGELDALEELGRDHARARVAPEHLRDVDLVDPGEDVVELLGVARLDAVVELLPDRPRELVDEPARVDEVERADALLRDPRRLVEEREVGLDLPRRVRAAAPSPRRGRRSGAWRGAPARSTRPRSGVSSNSAKRRSTGSSSSARIVAAASS